MTSVENTVDDIIHIALSPWDLSDSYNRHAAVTIQSILANLGNCKNIVFHILYDYNLSSVNPDLCLINRMMYVEFIEKYGGHVIFHHVSVDPQFYEIPAVEIYTVATLFRLYLPEILPNVNKVIYLDCDMVVNLDICELYSIDIDKYPLAAVTRGGNFKKLWALFYKNVKISPELYFNAGLLLMNLEKLRSENSLVTMSLSYFSKYPDSPYLDQDFLNWAFQRNYLHLDKKYNVISSEYSCDNLLNECIIHYESAINKPWKSYSGKVDDYYWKYLSETPWGGNAQLLAKYARDAPDRQMFIASISQWLYRYPIKKQLVILCNLSGILWVSLIMNYFKTLAKILTALRYFW